MSKLFKKFKKFSLFDWANFYYEKGMSIIPLAPLKKTPAIESWKEYQERRPELKEIVEWFGGKEKHNIAIICGSVSGNLVVIDFDREDLYNKFREGLLRSDIDLYNKFMQTWIVKTRKGYHVYFRIDIPVEEFKKKVSTEHPGERTIDIQAEGAYVVAPPSDVLSDDGKMKHKYYFLEGFSPDDNPEPAKLTWKEWEKIHNIIKDILKEIGAEEKKTQQTVSVPSQTKETEQQKPEKPIVYSGKMRLLSDNELIELKELYKDSWKPGNRHYLALTLSGWFAKSNVHPISVAKVFMMLIEENQDPEPEDRLSTIYYTYSKAYGNIDELKDLDKYIEELKAEGKIRRNVSKRTSEEIEPIKGKSGVQEILERTVGEERALEIIRRTEEILGTASPFNDSVIIITDFDSGLGYVNNTRKLRIYRCKREENGNEKEIRLMKLVWEGAITRLTVYNNPLGGITKYEITWESQTRPKPLVVSGNLEEIYDRLRIEGFLSNNRFGRDALSNIINAFIIRGKAEVKTEVDSPGFYVVDNKLINIKYGISEPTIEELKEALLLLNELAEAWYSHAKEKFATVIKWGIVAPFAYARKQLGRQYQIPHLTLYGARNTGKTTLAEIVSIYLWGLDRARYSYAGTQTNTEARLGDKISKSTFPIIINEANSMFYKPEIINMLKNSVEELTARGKFTKYEYIDIPALSQIIFTLNPSPKVDFEELMLAPKTMLLLNFSEGEILPQEKILEFKKEIEPKLPKLKAIGQHIAKIVLEKGTEILKKDWEELAIELVKQTYVDAGLEPPEWLSLSYEQRTFEDIEMERLVKTKEAYLKHLDDEYIRHFGRAIQLIQKGDQQGYYPVEPTIRDKFEGLLSVGALTYIRQKEGKLYITTGILKIPGLEFESLKSLAELWGLKYIDKKSFKEGGRVINVSVIETTKEEFIKFLEGE